MAITLSPCLASMHCHWFRHVLALVYLHPSRTVRCMAFSVVSQYRCAGAAGSLYVRESCQGIHRAQAWRAKEEEWRISRKGGARSFCIYPGSTHPPYFNQNTIRRQRRISLGKQYYHGSRGKGVIRAPAQPYREFVARLRHERGTPGHACEGARRPWANTSRTRFSKYAKNGF